jgi:hypothetical protein
VITTSYDKGDENMAVNDSDEEHVIVAERDFKD